LYAHLCAGPVDTTSTCVVCVFVFFRRTNKSRVRGVYLLPTTYAIANVVVSRAHHCVARIVHASHVVLSSSVSWCGDDLLRQSVLVAPHDYIIPLWPSRLFRPWWFTADRCATERRSLRHYSRVTTIQAFHFHRHTVAEPSAPCPAMD